MRHRIAIGGIHIESSTFSPHHSEAADFTVVRGDELLARYDDLPRHVDWLPLVHARALPGGAVERDFYASVKASSRRPSAATASISLRPSGSTDSTRSVTVPSRRAVFQVAAMNPSTSTVPKRPSITAR